MHLLARNADVRRRFLGAALLRAEWHRRCLDALGELVAAHGAKRVSAALEALLTPAPQAVDVMPSPLVAPPPAPPAGTSISSPAAAPATAEKGGADASDTVPPGTPSADMLYPYASSSYDIARHPFAGFVLPATGTLSPPPSPPPPPPQSAVAASTTTPAASPPVPPPPTPPLPPPRLTIDNLWTLFPAAVHALTRPQRRLVRLPAAPRTASATVPSDKAKKGAAAVDKPTPAAAKSAAAATKPAAGARGGAPASEPAAPAPAAEKQARPLWAGSTLIELLEVAKADEENKEKVRDTGADGGPKRAGRACVVKEARVEPLGSFYRWSLLVFSFCRAVGATRRSGEKGRLPSREVDSHVPTVFVLLLLPQCAKTGHARA